MRHYIFFIVCSCLIGFNTLSAQLVQVDYVRPNQTDNQYSAEEDSSYVARISNPDKNILFLFLGGGGSSPKTYWGLTRHVGSLGYHSISLCYSNDTGAKLLADDPDSSKFYKLRQEVCFGTPVFDDYEVDTLHSIRVRTIKLLQYLDNTFPSENWGQYLNGDEPNWAQIIVSGHSLGSGNTLYLAQQYQIRGGIFFSGPNDYSEYHDSPAFWLNYACKTNKERFFCYESLYDEITPYANQIKNVNYIGLIGDSTGVDYLTPPYENSHNLYTREAPGAALLYHSSPIKNSAKNREAWEYMLGVLANATVTNTTVTNANEIDIKIYPNPAHDYIVIEGKDLLTVTILDVHGVVVKELSLNDQSEINLTELSAGIYLVKAHGIHGAASKMISIR